MILLISILFDRFNCHMNHFCSTLCSFMNLIDLVIWLSYILSFSFTKLLTRSWAARFFFFGFCSSTSLIFSSDFPPVVGPFSIAISCTIFVIYIQHSRPALTVCPVSYYFKLFISFSHIILWFYLHFLWFCLLSLGCPPPHHSEWQQPPHPIIFIHCYPLPSIWFWIYLHFLHFCLL